MGSKGIAESLLNPNKEALNLNLFKALYCPNFVPFCLILDSLLRVYPKLPQVALLHIKGHWNNSIKVSKYTLFLALFCPSFGGTSSNFAF
jgi:hypothetical protein